MTQKTITGWVVVDWKKGKVRARKTEPKQASLGSNELLAKLKFEVDVPEVDVPTLAAEIEVPEPMVYSATLDALEEEDMPDYARAADEAVADRRDEITDAAVGHPDDLQAIHNAVVVETLQNAPGRPDVERVKSYVGEAIQQVYGDWAEEGEGGSG